MRALESVDEWWARLGEQKQTFVKGLADMIPDLSRDAQKAIEITCGGQNLIAKLVLILKTPTGGRAETN